MSKSLGHIQGLADHYIDLLEGWAKLEKRPLFGAIALYRNHYVFAMVWNGALYFKVDDESLSDYVKAKSHMLSYTSEGATRELKSSGRCLSM
ncbi:MAG: TfoX/Sxy family protein [Xanthomonadaceae bacterium]|nr:TfoX/Sxy family protein [Xanthomonadaceae bacterium]